MITTPICDFVQAYASAQPVRMHMPGHKGVGPLGFEALDITEIDGADELYAPTGIIAESEANAARLFGARTFYSAEGSSLAIRAMLALAAAGGERPLVLAGRNAHRAFLSAAALLEMDVEWLHPAPGEAYHSCRMTPGAVDAALTRLGGRCQAVYVTSPDYLGHVADIAALAGVCHDHGALLLVDNAHGAYLKFLPGGSRHPIDLGADMCCDSAHKTLPAVTGAAYLHLRQGLDISPARVREALALFGSSSPSWLILQSLDACNRLLADYPAMLADFLPKLDALKARLSARGWALAWEEPMKLTLSARPYGWTGDALAGALAGSGIYSEFHDPDFLTLMPTPLNTDGELARLEAALEAIPRREPLPNAAPKYRAARAALSVRAASFAPRETLPVGACAGRVLAAPALSCPPCVPIAVCGEVIDAGIIERLRYYGIGACEVVRQ